ncbi:hypothetical protein B1R27_09410 [Streptomyces sp. GKU 895]|nr:hypothetical protein B1R27_09410 [Streptomyces sp. GKU 895]
MDAEAFATVTAESLRQMGGGTAVTAPEWLGDRRYRLLERLEPGGRVWRAQDAETDRTVVVRLHRPITERARRQAFLRDAEILRGIEHHGVVTVHDFGIEDGVPYLVMEELDGIPLSHLAGGSGGLVPAPLLVSIAAQVARALLACHLAGVTHGGLDMAAVMLLPDGAVKVTQFAPGRVSGPGGARRRSAGTGRGAAATGGRHHAVGASAATAAVAASAQKPPDRFRHSPQQTSVPASQLPDGGLEAAP